jgi:heme-degrading monooxygenase HmoA
MTELITTGTWHPKAGAEDAFVAAWMEFAGWASEMPGAGLLRLGRDTRDTGRFVSFGAWESAGAAHDWKASPEFRERMARVQEHVERFEPAELDLVATADAGATTVV